MLSISSPSASLPFVRGATGLRLISLTVMQSLNVVFHVGLNKLLTKPAYDVTVMDDLALGGASLLSAHYVPVYLKQSCWHKFVDAAKTDRIKEVRYQICICVYNSCWCDVLTIFSKRDKLEIGGVNPLVRKRWRATACCGKSKFAISSGWLTKGSVCHPDDIITLP